MTDNLSTMSAAELDKLCDDLQAKCRRPINAATGAWNERQLEAAVAAYREAIQRELKQ